MHTYVNLYKLNKLMNVSLNHLLTLAIYSAKVLGHITMNSIIRFIQYKD